MFGNRDIFPYFNGERDVHGDPVRIMAEFCAACDGDPRPLLNIIDPANVDAPFQQKRDASIRVYEAAHKAFRLVPFDEATGAGSTEQNTCEVIAAFFQWTNQKKTSGGTAPTLPPVMAAAINS